MTAMGPPVIKAITMAKMIMSGLRMAMRISIMKACCTLLVSVVRRVTSELVLKRSMLLKEKVWMLANMSWRRFLAKPAEAMEQVMPAPAPHRSETRASAIRMAA